MPTPPPPPPPPNFGTLYVARPDADDPNEIRIASSDDGEVWGPDAQLSPLRTSGRPGLAAFRARLYGLFRTRGEAARGGPNLLVSFTYNQPVQWEPGTLVPAVETESSPSVTVFQNHLVSAFRAPGTGGGDAIAGAGGLLRTVTMAITPGEAVFRWEPATVAGVRMVEGPALGVYSGRLFCAYQTSEPLRRLNYAVFDPGAGSWTVDLPVGGASITQSPSLGTYRAKLYAFYHDGDHANHLSFASFDGAAWALTPRIPGVRIAGSPAVVNYRGRLYCFYRDADDSALKFTFLDSTGATVPGKLAVDAQGNPLLMSGSPAALYTPLFLFAGPPP